MFKPPTLGGLTEARDNYRNVAISESKLHEFFPPQVQLMSKQRRDLYG